MLTIIFNAIITLLVIFAILHFIAAGVMAYSACLTRPKGLSLRATIEGIVVQASVLYRVYWYKPWILILSGLNGIFYLKKKTADGNHVHDHVTKVTELLFAIMNKLPDVVISRTVENLNSHPVFSGDDSVVISFEELVIEIYRDSHPALKAINKANQLTPSELATAKEIYGKALIESVQEANDEVKILHIHPAEVEHRILHVTLVLLGVLGEKDPFERYLPNPQARYILKDLNK